MHAVSGQSVNDAPLFRFSYRIFNVCRVREVILLLEHLSNWFAGSASWRTAFFLEKCVLHGQAVDQAALGIAKLHEAGRAGRFENDSGRAHQSV